LGFLVLPQSFNGIGVTQKMRVHPFLKTGFLGSADDYLISPGPVDRKEPFAVSQLMAEGVGLQAFGQGHRAGYPAGFAALAHETEGRPSFKDFQVIGRQGEGFGNPEAGLK
jgi:hypothetical protein